MSPLAVFPIVSSLLLLTSSRFRFQLWFDHAVVSFTNYSHPVCHISVSHLYSGVHFVRATFIFAVYTQ